MTIDSERIKRVDLASLIGEICDREHLLINSLPSTYNLASNSKTIGLRNEITHFENELLKGYWDNIYVFRDLANEFLSLEELSQVKFKNDLEKDEFEQNLAKLKNAFEELNSRLKPMSPILHAMLEMVGILNLTNDWGEESIKLTPRLKHILANKSNAAGLAVNNSGYNNEKTQEVARDLVALYKTMNLEMFRRYIPGGIDAKYCWSVIAKCVEVLELELIIDGLYPD